LLADVTSRVMTITEPLPRPVLRSLDRLDERFAHLEQRLDAHIGRHAG